MTGEGCSGPLPRQEEMNTEVSRVQVNLHSGGALEFGVKWGGGFLEIPPHSAATLSEPLLNAFLEDGLIGVPHCVYDIRDRVNGDASSFVQRTETKAVILVHLLLIHF